MKDTSMAVEAVTEMASNSRRWSAAGAQSDGRARRATGARHGGRRYGVAAFRRGRTAGGVAAMAAMAARRQRAGGRRRKEEVRDERERESGLRPINRPLFSSASLWPTKISDLCSSV